MIPVITFEFKREKLEIPISLTEIFIDGHFEDGATIHIHAFCDVKAEMEDWGKLVANYLPRGKR